MNKIYFAVCDDDEITCDVVCRRIFAIFKKCGIEASGAKYFSSATLYNHIAYSREGEAYKYDLVFLDIDMPKYSGMAVAEEIRKNRPIQTLFSYPTAKTGFLKPSLSSRSASYAKTALPKI